MADKRPDPGIADKRLCYDIPQAAAVLGMGRNAVYEAARRGDIPVIKIGKLLRVPKAALHRLLETPRRNDRRD